LKILRRTMSNWFVGSMIAISIFICCISFANAYILANNRWGVEKPLTYAVKQRTDTMTDEEMFEGLRQAFETWANETELLRFELLPPNSKFGLADFKIRFRTGSHGDAYPFIPGSSVLAHAFSPQSGKIHFDSSKNFRFIQEGSPYSKGQDDFLYSAIHEIGHALGLEHSKDSKSVMNKIYGGYGRYTLGQDDIQAIRELYSPKGYCCSEDCKNSKCTKLLEAQTSMETCCQTIGNSFWKIGSTETKPCSETFNYVCPKGKFMSYKCKDGDGQGSSYCPKGQYIYRKCDDLNMCEFLPGICGDKRCGMDVDDNYYCY